MNPEQQKAPLHILLADDDRDDRFFFEGALKRLSVPTHLTTVTDGEKLMDYLSENSGRLPDILFLDLNMPRKKGSECLEKIKSNDKLKHLPVIIYSTSLNDIIADVLYQKGAHYYVKKCDIGELKKILEYVLTLLQKNNLAQPTRDEFVINMVKV